MNKWREKKSMSCLFNFSFLLILGLSSCLPVGKAVLPTPTSRPTATSQAVLGSSNYRAARSIKELVGQSSVIVSGQFSATKEVINMARDINDINQPDSHVLGLGQVYQFEVTQYLKGNGPKTIFVVQPEGFLVGDQVGNNLNDANIKKARALEKYIPARLKHPYLLFLEPLVGFPDLKNYYTGAIHPWRFNLSNPDQAVPESPWEGALSAFPARKASVLLYQVVNPDQVGSYPPPNLAYP